MIINEDRVYPIEYRDGMTITEFAIHINDILAKSDKEKYRANKKMFTSVEEVYSKEFDDLIDEMSRRENAQIIRVGRNVFIIYGLLYTRYIKGSCQYLKQLKYPDYFESIRIDEKVTHIVFKNEMTILSDDEKKLLKTYDEIITDDPLKKMN
jgi:hypothetical protein